LRPRRGRLRPTTGLHENIRAIKKMAPTKANKNTHFYIKKYIKLFLCVPLWLLRPRRGRLRPTTGLHENIRAIKKMAPAKAQKNTHFYINKFIKLLLCDALWLLWPRRGRLRPTTGLHENIRAIKKMAPAKAQKNTHFYINKFIKLFLCVPPFAFSRNCRLTKVRPGFMFLVAY
jgi:hypothetical protein